MGDLISRTVALKYLQEQQAEIIKEKHSESRALSYDTILTNDKDLRIGNVVFKKAL